MKKQLQIEIDDNHYLTLLKDDYAQGLFSLIETDRTYLRKWLPWLDNNKHLQNTIDYIMICEKQYNESKSLQLGIFYKGEICGMIGFHNIDWINHSTNIGYWLREAYQGKGIVTSSCRGLIDYAFLNLGLNRVEIRCAPENKRSRAIPERLEFVYEGVIREAEWLYDHYLDHIVYSMLKDEWEAR